MAGRPKDTGEQGQERGRRGAIHLSLGPKILDRYVAMEFLFSYVVAFSVVLSLRVIMDMFVQLDEFVESGEGAWTSMTYIGRYYGPKVFEYFRDFSGTIILLAAAFALARMMRHNELTAVLASGVSLKRVIAPIVFLGFGLNLLMVADQELVLPRLADKLVRRADEMHRLRTLRVWLMPDKRNHALLSAQAFDAEEQTLQGVHITLREGGRAVGQVTAASGQWDTERHGWALEGGVYWDLAKASNEALAFYPSDVTPQYLWLQRNKNFKSLMSSADLGRLQQLELKAGDRAETITEKHFRFTDPITNMVMLLLGLPLLVSREKRSTKSAILLSLLGAGGCFVVTFACKLMVGEDVFGRLLQNQDFEYALIAWLPIIVFLPLSVLALDSIKT